ncbi:hypothetical protein VTK56DRAFT_7246 [Thermocarpiscus australiensis]
MTVGPDSVDYMLTTEAIVFGGNTLTATDCAVCADPSLNIGNPELVKALLTEDVCRGVRRSGCGEGALQGEDCGRAEDAKRGLCIWRVYIEGGDVVDPDARTRVGRSAADSAFRGRIKIPFKNENIASIRIPYDAKEGDLEQQKDVLATVPDLICVIDTQNGEAVGTPEYGYGLLVVVLGLAASDKWTGSRGGIELGGPKASGFEHLEYAPLRRFVKPASVIDEHDVLSET